jgi:uncharacterized repeat protein (TIGR02543 family)
LLGAPEIKKLLVTLSALFLSAVMGFLTVTPANATGCVAFTGHNQDSVTYNLAVDCTAAVTGGVPIAGTVTIPTSVTRDSVSFTVTSIADGAFHAISALRHVNFPKTLQSIGLAFAYTGLSGLLDLSALTSLTFIQYYAFQSSTALTSVIFPPSLTSLGQQSFYLTGVTQATFTGPLPTLGVYLPFNAGTVVRYCGAATTWSGFSVVSGSCSVAFDSGAGSPVPSQTVAFGEVFSEPSSPTRSGYVFDGWFTTSGGVTPFLFPEAASQNATAYAGWVEASAPAQEVVEVGTAESVEHTLAATGGSNSAVTNGAVLAFFLVAFGLVVLRRRVWN